MRRLYTGWTQEEEQKAAELYAQYVTFREIGEILERSGGAVDRKIKRLRKRGLPKRPRKAARRRTPIAEIYEKRRQADAPIAELFRDGWEPRHIARKLGLSRNVVISRIHRMYARGELERRVLSRVDHV